MHPADINAALKKSGSSQSDIARSLNPPVSCNAVSLIIYGRGKSRRIADAISDKTLIPISVLWPKKYAA